MNKKTAYQIATEQNMGNLDPNSQWILVEDITEEIEIIGGFFKKYHEKGIITDNQYDKVASHFTKLYHELTSQHQRLTPKERKKNNIKTSLEAQ